MNPQVSIENFHTGMMPQIVSLFSSFFPPQDRLLTSDYNNWLYLENPFGVAQVVSVTDGTDWVGFMALIPIVFERRDSQLKAYFGVNVLVHPQYFGKNIFGRMIVAAREHVAKEGAALMGHPNDMAVVMWRRKKMHFHNPLRPAWLGPQSPGRGVKRNIVDHLELDSPLWGALKKQRQESTQWQLQISPEFLTWRFLKHPTNHYRVYWLETDGQAVGVQITKSMRHAIHLLLDSFVLSPYARRAQRGLPWLTLSMRPRNNGDWFNDGFWSLPVKKQMPFFLTNDSQQLNSDELMSLGLTASDL